MKIAYIILSSVLLFGCEHRLENAADARVITEKNECGMVKERIRYAANRGVNFVNFGYQLDDSVVRSLRNRNYRVEEITVSCASLAMRAEDNNCVVTTVSW